LDLYATDSLGDNDGIVYYTMRLNGVTSFMHRSPRTNLGDMADGSDQQASGFTVFRSHDSVPADKTVIVSGLQDTILPTPYLIHGFGQKASGFLTEFPGKILTSANAQLTWDASLLLAEGTYAPGNPPSFGADPLEAIVPNTGVSLIAASTVLKTVPEPGSIVLAGLALVGLVAFASRRS
jgi:hypothetical protein